jgi:Putative transposase
LPVPYFHVVFTVPEQIAQIAFSNKETVYNILFRATAETLLTIAGDPQHLGAGIGFFAILHTWGQNLLHHPHLHCVVPGGGLSPDHERWIACLPGFFLPVSVLSRLFRRLFLEELEDAFYRGQLCFPGSIEPLQDAFAFAKLLRSQEDQEWVVYAKPPFGGPQQAIEYLGRYTHRVAISNQRLLSDEDGKVSFQWKDYKHENKQNSKIMTVEADDFIRRFLIHTLPPGFQRIRHFGFLANCHRAAKLVLCRELLIVPLTDLLPSPADCRELLEAIAEKEFNRCPHCGIGTMIRVAILPRYLWPAVPPPDSS